MIRKPWLWYPIALLLLLAQPVAAQMVCGPAGRGPQHPQQQPARQPQQPHGVLSSQHPAVVRIRTHDGGNVHSLGVGCLMHVHPTQDMALVLTAAHVIQDARSVAVYFHDGTGYAARVGWRDRQYDIAILEIRRPKVRPPRFRPMRPVRGAVMHVASIAQGTLQLIRGAVVGFNRGQHSARQWAVVGPAPTRSGDSGGPMFNERGELVGVIWGAADGQARIALLEAVWPQIVAHYPGLAPSETPEEPTVPDAPDASAPPMLTGRLVAIEGRLDQIESRLAKIGDGQPGPQGPPGKDGRDGADGKPGLPGPPGAAQEIDIEALAKAVAQRLPPIYFRTVDGHTGELIKEPVGIRLGEGFTFRVFRFSGGD